MSFRLAQFGFRFRLLDDPPGGSSGGTGTTSTPGSGTSSPTAPASSPSGSPGSASPGASSSSASDGAPSTPDFDFTSIFEAPSDTPLPPVVVPAQPGPPVDPLKVAPAAAPAAPAAAQSQPPAAQPAAAPPASGQQAPAQQPAAASSPLFDPADPISLARALSENESAAIEHVAQTMFQLSPEDIGALEADVAGTVPKLLAKVVVKTNQQMLAQLGRIVPIMIGRHQEMVQRHTLNEGQFYKAWTQLDPAKHGTLVRELGAQYRRMNPDASLEKMIQDLGPFVLMRAGLPLTGAALTPQAQPAAQPSQPAAFVPAGPGAVGHQTAAEPGTYDFLGQRS